MSKLEFSDKDEARQYVWDRLERENGARFPFYRMPHPQLCRSQGGCEAVVRAPGPQDLEAMPVLERLREMV